VHALSEALQSEPAQQFCPSPPHVTQEPPAQRAFALQLDPLQQAWPGAPHGPPSGPAPPVPLLPPVPIAPPAPLVVVVDPPALPVLTVELELAVVLEPLPVAPPAPDPFETSVPASAGGPPTAASSPHANPATSAHPKSTRAASRRISPIVVSLPYAVI
jgi:hypothetical protein